MKILNRWMLSCCLLMSTPLVAQVKVEINTNESDVKIDKNIYGHFAEHLGRCIYGGFYVGEDSDIPNTAGVRNDVVKALKDLKIPNLRWPGGCFADTYHWKDGVGPKEDRPTIVNKWWGGVTEDNSFGTHDFLNMCELLEAEPYLSANVGSGTVQEVADWAQYVTHDGQSPMSEYRIENGRKEPWDVKFWGIGNEAWGCGGNMTPEYYSNIYRKYVTFMPGGLYRIASGASSDDYNWTEVLMKNIPNHMIEGMALHHYSVIDWGNKGPAATFSEEQYFKIMKQALRMEELIEKHSAIMDKYDPEKKIDLVVDEWGGWYDVEEGTNPGFLYQQNTMRDAMIAGATLNIFNNHAERVRMANLAQAINVLQAVILTDKEKMILTPTYWVMKMYSVHQDAQLLPLKVDEKFYSFGDDKLPAISASASKDSNGKIHISVVNIDAKKANDITFSLGNVDLKNAKAEILTSAQLQDHNTFEQSDKIKPAEFKKFKAKKGELTLTVPPFSVVVFEVN